MSSSRRLFFETSSGSTLSMLICRKSRPAAVQLLDPLRDEEVAVGDQAGHHAADADMADQGVEIRVQHRLAAAEGDDRGAEVGQLVDAPAHRRRSAPARDTLSYSLQ